MIVQRMGNFTKDSYGCPDLDGDGWSDLADDFFNKPSQWNDTDGDGMGDNWRVHLGILLECLIGQEYGLRSLSPGPESFG